VIPRLLAIDWLLVSSRTTGRHNIGVEKARRWLLPTETNHVAHGVYVRSKLLYSTSKKNFKCHEKWT
jgi:hypothetical protein